MSHNYSFAFFGTPEFAVSILEELKKKEILPSLVVTAPDKKVGRGLMLTAPPVKVWAEENYISVIQPEKIDEAFLETLREEGPYDFFVVAAYGKILPQNLLDIPKKGTLNVHPSLLPLYRGSSPIEGAILSGDKETGVSIMLLDDKMDHGPILATEKIVIGENISQKSLEKKLSELGGALLSHTIPLFLSGKIVPQEQEHEKATYTKKITKQDGLLFDTDNDETKWRKYKAFEGWPGVYFFVEKGGTKTRVVIKEASFEAGVFKILRVIPEGKKEIAYEEFLRG